MELFLPKISEQGIESLVEDINQRGFGVLTDYIAPPVLEMMRAFVNAAVRTSGGEYVGFNTPKALVGSMLDQISSSPEFQDLLKQIYEVGTGKPGPEVEFYQVLRCLAGASGRKHSLRFHYDSYVVTALIPVEIPAEGKCGDLIMLPNSRNIRSSYAVNVIDKLLLDNALSQFALRTLARMNCLPLARINPIPGNIYFFWGYRSIHTNEPCDQDKVRATALFHYVNPHAARSLKSGSRRPSANGLTGIPAMEVRRRDLEQSSAKTQ